MRYKLNLGRVILGNSFAPVILWTAFVFQESKLLCLQKFKCKFRAEKAKPQQDKTTKPVKPPCA